MDKQQWFLIKDQEEYDNACTRYQEVKRALSGTIEHREKILLAHLISFYEKSILRLPDVDPIEIIRIRMNDMNLKQADLAEICGGKGAVSGILNYRYFLSKKKILGLSELLRVPVDCLSKSYQLNKGRKLKPRI